MTFPTNVARIDMKDIHRLIAEAGNLSARGDREGAVAQAIRAGIQADARRDLGSLIESGTLLERLGEYSRAGRYLGLAGLMMKPCPIPEWTGGILTDKTFVVLQRIRDIGSPIRLARLIPPAARGARRCIVLSERRLVPIYRRSFPDFDIREAGIDDAAALAEADVAASYETLLTYEKLNTSTERVVLRPDPVRVAQLRARYGAGGEPIIGISWCSTNARKDLPSLSDWRAALPAIPGTLVSLQYGDVVGDVAELSRSGRQVILDPEIDALDDLDGFSAQVAAMDAVLSISTTCVHVAGALGIPATVLLDDLPHLIWSPGALNAEPWYRNVSLVRRHGRDWGKAFAQAIDSLRCQLAASGHQRTALNIEHLV